MLWLTITLGVVLAGFVQTVSGFGSVVVMMIMFPFFFSIIDAPALALAINMLYCTILCWKYRRDIDFKATLLPTLLYSVVGFAVTGMVGDADLRTLVIVFAIFLMLLSLYLLLISHRVQLKKPKAIVGVGCGILAGVSSGLFAIGGPTIAPYMIAATKDHKSYVASMQFLFTVTNIVNLAGRMINGIFNYAMWPYIAVGTVCILIGMKLGEVVAAKLDPARLRMIVYSFVGISGLILLLQQL